MLVNPEKESISLEDAYKRIFKYYCSNNSNNKYDANYSFNNLKEFFDLQKKESGIELNIETLTPLNIEDYKQFLLTKNTESTKNHNLRCLKAYINKLIFWELIKTSIADKIKYFKGAEKERLNFSEFELELIFKAFKKENNDNTLFYNICKVALLSGMRSGEILNLQWRDIDFINK
jgi:integrase